MDFLLIGIVAFGASWLTLISGFGLGTLMLPVFVLFFPPLEAVAMTAVVHFLNNVFKISLLYRQIDKNTVIFFGLSGIVGAFIGAYLSASVDDSVAYASPVNGEEVMWLSVVIGVTMIVFALQELIWGKRGMAFKPKYLVPGGLVSGFFGGLSGHQGALRSMFLLKSGLSSQAYIASGVAIAMMVDLTRIPIYLNRMADASLGEQWPLLTTAVLCAFIGAYIGKRLLNKVTFRTIQWIVGLIMILLGLALLSGLLG